MRRIACPLVLGGLIFAPVGCAPDHGKPEYARPLPDPVLVTRKPEVIQPIPPPRMEESSPEPPMSVPRDWIPPGGIKRQWKEIVVHHSGKNTDSPQSMHAWHLKRGWENGLGYHFVIGNGVGYPDGAVFVGPRWKLQKQGAHCSTKTGGIFAGKWRPANYFNDYGIGICLVGNFNSSSPTARQMESLRRLTQWLCEETGIPGGSIRGHGHITRKTECPGKNLSLGILRRRLGGLQASAN